jgi:hypothetical protein
MATRYPLNLPTELKQAAARLAKQQGVSLNQFFLWSISEKVTELKTSIDDPRFPTITYRRGASGYPNSCRPRYRHSGRNTGRSPCLNGTSQQHNWRKNMISHSMR